MEIMTAGVIRNNAQQVLLVRRTPGQLLGGYWEFPGRKVESNETEKDCLKRELKEELSIGVNVGQLFYDSHYVYDHGELLLKACEAELINGEATLHVHDMLDWVKPQALQHYRRAPADIPIAIRLVEVP